MKTGNKAWAGFVGISLILSGCAENDKKDIKSVKSESFLENSTHPAVPTTDHPITIFQGSLNHLIGPADEVAYVKTFPFMLYKIYSIEGVGAFYIDNRQDMVKNQLRNGTVWEDNIVQLIRTYARPGTTAVDIGAHIGAHTISMSRYVGDNGRVIAFEPQIKIYSELVMNVVLNKRSNITAYRAAVGDRIGKIELNPAIVDNEGSTGVGKGGDRAELIPLDSLNLTNVSLIKIDVENFEYEVLLGAEETIRRNRPYLIIEIMGNIYSSISNRTELVHRTLKKVEDLGYSLEYLEDSWSSWLASPKKI